MVDEQVVVTKLRLINEYTHDLEEMRGTPLEEYVADTMRQRAVERTFTNLIQCCIDLAQHIRSTERLSPSETSKEEIETLATAGILSPETSRQIEDAVGFRNLLTHRYGDINNEVVHRVLHEDLH
ncbi:MAG: hypothetical protein J07HB67_02431 [halophilic archaeon J07HB67]|jgi:Uncharacterized conserved protein|nr:MAG: hypothetical protein J07HB67_02431 [halophilic archaeon J07HB67]